MIDESGEGPDSKKLVFFTNFQAGLFTLELIPQLLAAFDLRMEPSWVRIWCF